MGADLHLKKILDSLFLHLLPASTQHAFLKCIELDFLNQDEWYLAGGTSLALQVGHRQSVDLDFFTTHSHFSENLIERTLLDTKNWETTYREKGTLYGLLLNAKMSLIAYPFFKPSGDWFHCGSIRMLKPDDIASMKIVAISQRGRKRDFLDLYWYCKFYKSNRVGANSLREVILRTLKQYPGQENNVPHILKSLTYFNDAEDDPMPTLHFKATWKEIKTYFQKEVPRLAKELLGIR